MWFCFFFFFRYLHLHLKFMCHSRFFYILILLLYLSRYFLAFLGLFGYFGSHRSQKLENASKINFKKLILDNLSLRLLDYFSTSLQNPSRVEEANVK